MSVNEADGNNEESKRKQKNLRLHERYHDRLEELAVEWFGSEQKQGQVVEKLLDLHGDDDVVGMIEEMHSVIVEGQSSHTQGSPQSSSTSSDSSPENDGVVAELERRAHEGEPIDPTEFDLEVIKGGKGVDRGEILARAILTTHTGLDKASIQKFIRREADYSPNAARDRRKEVLDVLSGELYDPVPGADWVSEQVEQDLREDRNKAREGGEGVTESKYRREYGKSVEAYAETRSDLPSDGPYANPQEAADAVYETLNVLLTAIDDSRSKYQKRRARDVMREVWERTDKEVRSTQPSDTDMTLEFIVASNEDLKDVVRGGSDD